ncbi:ATP synthase subunit b [Sulfidibacter corallicola]|uniref:ATP synthase subunit b n=1 Tax=Sulfidibacter corallicola TaxID=2818388 RepID=A0A8A4TY79_SULCO|nr:ATP synthase F0 subunit B [Sulfidibacter corallicola]QTD54287.1 ATP synthase F0 subunit B [Sulfidibacter corallicola]
MEEILNSLPGPMQVNVTSLVIAAIFLVLIVVLNNLIFKPIVEKLDERARRIKDGAEAKKSADKTVEESLAALNNARVEARREAQNKRLEILKESEMAREVIITSAKEKALGMVQAAATELDQQVEKAKSTLREETKGMADQIVASVLSRSVS